MEKQIQAIWKIDSAKIIATIYRFVRDFSLAEDFAQEAFLAALEKWPASGLPEKPAAWLITVAKRKAIDFFRREKRQDRLSEELFERAKIIHNAYAFDDTILIKDDLLRLIFTICHPSLTPHPGGARVKNLVRLQRT